MTSTSKTYRCLSATSGSDLHYTVTPKRDAQLGPSPTFVLVHGLGANTRSWDAQIPLLRKYGTSIAIDLPGHGESSLPIERLNFPAMLSATRDLLHAEAIKSAVFVGHSLGGLLIRQLYRETADLFHGAIFVDAPPVQLHSQLSEKIVRHFLPRSIIPRMARPMIARFAGPDMSIELKQSILSDYDATSPRAVSDLTMAIIDEKAAPNFCIDVPTLCINGLNGPYQDQALKTKCQAFIPDLIYENIPGAAHYPMQEKPKETNAHIEHFLQERLGAKGGW